MIMTISSALGLAIAILVLSIAFAVANKHYKVASQSTFIWLLILPLIVFGVASGLVKKLTAPGGVSAEFGDVAREPVGKSARTTPPDVSLTQEVADAIAKQATPPNSSEIEALVDGQPIFLTLTLGEQFYTPNGLIDYIKFIMQKDKDLLVVFVDKNNKFWAMADPNKLLLFVRDQTMAKNLIDEIKAGLLPKVPVLIFEPLHEDTSNAQALQTMVKNNLRAMVVVNKDNEPKAIAERDKIVAQLVTQLAASQQQ